jgi:heterodisulfide reductase subunit C2
MTTHLVTEKGKEFCNPSFAKEVKVKSRAHLERCYQCVACSSGCPGAYQMDYPPHQLLRMVQLGLKDSVLNSNTYWICLSCETCAARCPNDIEIVLVMDTLREMALQEKRRSTTNLPLFHNTFLSMVKFGGKTWELGLIGIYMVKSGDIFKLKKMFKDMKLGVKMFSRGKMAIIPPRIKGKSAIKRIFELSKKSG